MSYFPNNSKFKQGDIVLIVDYRQNHSTAKGEIVGWRGGGVAGYEVQIIEPLVRNSNYKAGEITYKSGRDMKLLNRSEPLPVHRYLTTGEKLDLLLEHLGLRIDANPQVIKVEKEEKS